MSIKSIGVVAFSLIVASIVVGVLAIKAVAYTFLVSPNQEKPAIEIVVERGESIESIATNLEEKEIIKTPFLFRLYGKLTGKGAEIKAGRFTMKPGGSISSIYTELTNPISEETTVTIIEGLTIKQIIKSLEDQGIKGTEDLEEKLTNGTFNEEFQFLNQVPAGRDIEGFIFPDTYRVMKEATAETVIRKSLQTFQEKILSNYNEQIEGDEYNLFEIITIASIIEREVREKEDMAQVSDIIRKRLAIGMPLQMDSTVNYITGKDTPSILYTDRDIDSPYNTYKYPGLPIGPISNPGENAINAALNPTPNDYYFFLTTPEGEVKYGKTTAEHNNNRQYLR